MNPNDFCAAPVGGVPGLDLSALPVVPDADALDLQAGELSGAGTNFRSSVSNTATGWNALAGPYRTPEQPQLLATFGPVNTWAQDVEEGTAAVASALTAFAVVCREVKASSNSLTDTAARLSSRIELKGDEWATDPQIVEEQHGLLSQLNSIKARFAEAEQECANTISGLYGGTRYVSADDSQAKPDGSNVYAIGAGTLDALAAQGELPWGAPVERAHLRGWLGAGQGLVDGAWGLASGLYSLSLLSLVWRPEVRELGLKTASYGDAWTGVGKTLWSVGMFISPAVWLDRAITGKQEEQDAAGAALAPLGPELIQLDAWNKGEWEYALTRNIFDAAGTVGTAGVGAGVKAGSLSARLGVRLAELGSTAAWGGRVAGLAKLGELGPSTLAKITDAVASVKVATWENLVKPGLDGSVTVLHQLDRLDNTPGAVLVGDGMPGLHQGPLGVAADTWLQKIDGMDRAVRRPSSIGDYGKAAQGREALTALKMEPLRDPARPQIQHVVRVPETMVPGPKSVWTKAVDGFAPNTEYVVGGRGSFITDAQGTIKEITVDKVKGQLSPELNNPLPDMTYRVETDKGNFTFATDEAGRTTKAHAADIQLGDGRRSQSIQSSVGRASNAEMWDGKPPSSKLSYQGGHLIARMFDGIEERINTVGMLKEINQNIGNASSYYKLEEAIRKKTLEIPPPRIDVEINLVRRPGFKTPSVIRAESWANGELFLKEIFSNIVGRE